MAKIKTKPDFTFKISLLGGPNVGKVEFINRFTDDKYSYGLSVTLGMDVK